MPDFRWKQRYANYPSMLNLLNDSFKGKSINDFSELEQIGLAKSFELSFELSWKLLKDYLEHKDAEIGLITPTNVFKTAASSGLLHLSGVDGDILMKAHKARNILVHVYDQEKFIFALADVKEAFLPELMKLNAYFKGLMNDDE